MRLAIDATMCILFFLAVVASVAVGCLAAVCMSFRVRRKNLEKPNEKNTAKPMQNEQANTK